MTTIKRRPPREPVEHPAIPPAVFRPPVPAVGPPSTGYRSGHCRADAPPESHRRCKGDYGTPMRPAPCICECHR